MFKIESEILAAIKTKSNFDKYNSQVVYLPAIDSTIQSRIEHSKIYLHGNHIATVNYERQNEVTVNIQTLKSWPTNTTKSRLRALGVNLSQKKGILYIDGVAI